MTVTAGGGSGTYTYSIDGGTTFQASNTFLNLGANGYTVVIRDSNGCEISEVYTIPEPFTLSASALVAELIECNPITGAETRIINARGGTTPYEYSFDGGATYSPNNISNLFPGDHTVYIRDANGCTVPFDVTVLPAQTPPGVTTGIDYLCDGDATITVTADDPQYTYTYEIDGVLNTPAGSNVFDNVAPGDHEIGVNYVITTVIPPSTLMFEDFGFGTNTPIDQIDPVYCYEPQDGSVSACPVFGLDTHIQDGEYSVTQFIVNPYVTWISPIDHTGIHDGRYLAINVGGVAGVGGIVYAKRNVEVLANQDITISLWAINLLRTGTVGGDPSMEIQLVDPLGNIIASTTTGSVPKNNGANDWRNYSVDLNPGANTTLDIVIRTNSSIENGNDIAIDDLLATQPPAKCPAQVLVNVTVEPGRELGANITGTSNVSCNGLADGAITFEVENFDPVNGFIYAVNGGAFSAPQTSSPINLTGLGTGNNEIEIRDALDSSCSVTINTTLTEPGPIVASATIASPFTCNNVGASITASAVGGTPTPTKLVQPLTMFPMVIISFE